MNSRKQIEEFFAYKHLPPHLQRVSVWFYNLAMHLEESLPSSAERTLALRTLWEAKNYAVWCAAQEGHSEEESRGE